MVRRSAFYHLLTPYSYTFRRIIHVQNVKEVKEFIEEKGIEMIDFKMVDINGSFRHVTIPASYFDEEMMS
ncbi:MAG: hypothetical protein IJM17_08780, partial [Firmicutes bacterium]|nr:hypothetical protein [Bacillota bacterium]